MKTKLKSKRFLSMLLCCVMLLGLLPTTAFAKDTGENNQNVETAVFTNTYTENSGGSGGEKDFWEISKSKTATNLDKNFESAVTLSLPAKDEQLVTDVVFVLDKSTSADLEDQALKMLTNLKEQVENTNAKVKVGVVIFNKEAHVTDFKDLATEYSTIEAAIKQDISSGTNTHAGLLAGKALLEGDTSVDDSRKYLVFVSDGITYMYNEEPTVTAWTFWADAEKNWAGPDNWYSKYGSNEAPSDWAKWMETTGAQVTAQGTDYEYPYGGTVGEATPLNGWQTNYANSVDKALYETCLVYQSLASRYHCYAMTATSNAQYPWAASFMNYLSGGQTINFDSIQNDILYLLDAGSKVVDVIGYGTDNFGNSYNFDFVNDANLLTLTVGGEKLNVTKLDTDKANVTACYAFGEGNYPFVLYYYANGQDGSSDECFVWEINVPVTIDKRVELTYTVKLTNPQTVAGEYGTFDADGSEEYECLHTNKSATLYPVDSNGNAGVAEDFTKPTVSYTIEPSTVPTDPSEPDKPAKPTETNPNTGAEAPKTGDNSNMALWIALLFVSAAGVFGTTVYGKKKKSMR